jgi:hypothetical protein
MMKNVNRNEFRTLKMAANGHFEKENGSCAFI